MIRKLFSPSGNPVKKINPSNAGYKLVMETEEMKSCTVLIVGGCYAGIAAATTLLALKDGRPMPLASYGNFAHLKNSPRIRNLTITVLDERDGFFHTIGTPLAHIDPESASNMWKYYAGFLQLQRPDIDFVQGSASWLNSILRTLTYLDIHGNKKFIKYDFLLISTGMRREWPVAPRCTQKSTYLEDALTHAQIIKAAEKEGVVVIGGGAVGVEVAGKIKMQHPNTRVTLIHSRGQLLSNEPLPDEFKAQALALLEAEGVEVILNERPIIVKLPDQRQRIQMKLKQMTTSHVFWATSRTIPSTSFIPENFLNKNGCLSVDEQQRVLGDPLSFGRIYAAGDITENRSIRIGGGAMVEGSIAAANIYSSLLSMERLGFSLVLAKLPQVYREPRMSLSIGRNAICYQGGHAPIEAGPKLAEICFGADLGWQSETCPYTAVNLDSFIDSPTEILNTLDLGEYESRS